MNLFVTVRTSDGTSHTFHMTPKSWAGFRDLLHNPGPDTDWVSVKADKDPELVFAYDHIVWVSAEEVNT